MMYAKLTDKQREAVISRYRDVRAIGGNGTNAKHATACVAHDVLCPGSRGWNGKKGGDAFAAALAVLVMADEIVVK